VPCRYHWRLRVSTERKVEPTRRQRGIKRRDELLDATLRLLGREGADAVTHRAVAEEANVPIAATTYYFDSKRDLLMEAFRRHAENEAERVAVVGDLGGAATAETLADRLADYIYEGLNEERMRLLAEQELLLQAARDPKIEPFSRVFYEAVKAELHDPLVRIGSEDPDQDAIIILAAFAGLEIDNLSTPRTALSRRRLRALMRRLLTRLVRPR
jgi:TetR/AcrR family transcriptional regulator, regulator of biofilm formation and stress response